MRAPFRALLTLQLRVLVGASTTAHVKRPVQTENDADSHLDG